MFLAPRYLCRPPSPFCTRGVGEAEEEESDAPKMKQVCHQQGKPVDYQLAGWPACTDIV